MEQEDEFLSQDEVDALLNGIGEASTASNVLQNPSGDIRPYDPTSRDYLGEPRLAVLENIHEKFSRALRIALAEFTKLSVDLTVSPIRILKYAELAHGVPAITGISLFSLAPLSGNGALFIDHNTTSVIIDTLFGGEGHASKEQVSREFTPIEIRMVEKVNHLTLECLRKSWSGVHPVEFAYLKSETHKQFLTLCAPHDPVIVISINLKIGHSGGEIILCLPYAAIEPIRHLLAKATEEENASADRNWFRLLSAQVQSAEVELNANLGTAIIPLRQIMEMKAGDFIPINVPDTVSAMVGGFPLMECNFGISNGQYSLRVERIDPQNQQEISHGNLYGN